MAVPAHRIRQALQQSKQPSRLAVVPTPPATKRKRTPEEKDRRASLRRLRSNAKCVRRYAIGPEIKDARTFLRDRDVFSDASYQWLCSAADAIVDVLGDVHEARRLMGREIRRSVEGMIESRYFSDERTGRALARIARAFKAREDECRRAPGWSWTTGWSDGSTAPRILRFGKPVDLFLDLIAVEAAQGKPFRSFTQPLDAEQYANAFRGALAAIYDLRPAPGSGKR